MIRLLHKRLALVAVVGVAAVLALYVESDDGIQTMSAPASATRVQAAAATGATDVDAADIVDIFAVRTWAPPPPVVVQAPPPPQAPPLPFRLLGQIDDGPEGRAFVLAQGDRVLNVSPGTTIDERYRLEKFESGQLHFLYLPLNLRQTLPVGNPL